MAPQYSAVDPDGNRLTRGVKAVVFQKRPGHRLSGGMGVT